MTAFRSTAFAFVTLVLAGCGATYDTPAAQPVHHRQAQKMFTEARAAPRKPKATVQQASARYERVIENVLRHAVKLCMEDIGLTEKGCTPYIRVDTRMQDSNAYFTYAGGKPHIVFSEPLMLDIQNDHELAFIFGHEYAHFLAEHIQKKQAVHLGAAILGAAVSEATDEPLLRDLFTLTAGATLSVQSQNHELQSDAIGAQIAYRAGYDPVIGARFFARPDSSGSSRSIWRTHPPNPQRIATVLATVERLEAGQPVERH